MRYGVMAVLILVPGGAFAQAADPSAQGDVSVTIYNNNVALVQDRRQLTLSNGRSRQEFPDVSAQIRPETVVLVTDGATIVEQNFDYDLLTPAKLLDKSVGRTITVVKQNPATGAETSETVEVLANNGGTIVRSGGRIEVLSGENRRLIFPSLPPSLRARPTLSVTLDATQAGSRPATLSYLTSGLSWKADYVALFDETAGKIDVQGWITLNNRSGTTYSNARTVLVAGQVGNGNGAQNGQYMPRPPRAVPGNQPGTESADRERLGDFYLYPIAGRTTIANAQQKQVSFLDVSGADAAKGYLFRNAWLGRQDDPVSTDTILRFSSMSGGGGLGDALPAGTVRVYMRDASAAPQFIGENSIPHLPMGSRIAMKTGEAFDVKVQPIVEKRDRITSDEWERTRRFRITTNGRTQTIIEERNVAYWRTQMRYVVTNARPTPVTVEVLQSGLSTYWSDTRVPSESITGEQRSADERAWMVPVPANGETVLTVTFDTRY